MTDQELLEYIHSQLNTPDGYPELAGMIAEHLAAGKMACKGCGRLMDETSGCQIENFGPLCFPCIGTHIMDTADVLHSVLGTNLERFDPAETWITAEDFFHYRYFLDTARVCIQMAYTVNPSILPAFRDILAIEADGDLLYVWLNDGHQYPVESYRIAVKRDQKFLVNTRPYPYPRRWEVGGSFWSGGHRYYGEFGFDDGFFGAIQVTVEYRPTGKDTGEYRPEVNWSAWGAQSPASAAEFAARLKEASVLANALARNLNHPLNRPAAIPLSA